MPSIVCYRFPSALTVVSGSTTVPEVCDGVRTLDLSRENGFGLNAVNISGDALSVYANDDDTGYRYAGPSGSLKRASHLALLSSTGPLQPPSPCPQGCNCTYQVSFSAPSFRCTDRPDFGGRAQFRAAQLLPNGTLFYASYSSSMLPGNDETELGMPRWWDGPSIAASDRYGFKEMPAVWVGWVTPPHEADDASKKTEGIVPHVMECNLFNSTYSYNLSFLGGKCLAKRLGVDSGAEPFLLGNQNWAITPKADSYKEVA